MPPRILREVSVLGVLNVSGDTLGMPTHPNVANGQITSNNTNMPNNLKQYRILTNKLKKFWEITHITTKTTQMEVSCCWTSTFMQTRHRAVMTKDTWGDFWWWPFWEWWSQRPWNKACLWPLALKKSNLFGIFRIPKTTWLRWPLYLTSKNILPVHGLNHLAKL